MSAASLRELLGELERARGLRGRLRILARSFDLLRSLDRTDRERVALKVGSDWAWKQLERAFMKDGKLSEGEQVIQQAFETIGSADPGELREAARRMRARDTDGLERAAVRTLERILEEDSGAPDEDAEPGAEDPPKPADLESAIETIRRAEHEDEPEKMEPTDDAVALPIAAAVENGAVRPPEAKRLPSPRQPTPRRLPDPPSAPAPLAPATPPPAPSAEPIANSTERLGALRALRTPGYARGLGAAGRKRLVARLGGSWAGRRAISAMIASGELSDLGEALTLFALLDRDSRRTWCLIDWIEHRPLAGEERERVLGAAPDEVSRRRLERRLRLCNPPVS